MPLPGKNIAASGLGNIFLPLVAAIGFPSAGGWLAALG